MRKILALVLSVAMLCSMCIVPAGAETATIVSEVETKYAVSEMLFNYDFEDEATAFDGLSANAVLPSWEKVDDVGAAVLTKSESGRVAWNISDSDERVAAFKTALSSKYLVYEYRLKADGTIRAQFGNNSMEYHTGNINSNYARVAEMGEDRWIEVTYVMDYTAVTDETQSGVMKKYMVNNLSYIKSLTPPTMASLCTSGKFFFSQLVDSNTDDGAKLYLDYMRVYAVDPETYAASEEITTVYEEDEMVIDLEFDTDTAFDGLGKGGALPTLDYVDNKNVAVFDQTNGTGTWVDFRFPSSDSRIADLKNKMAAGPVAFEVSMKSEGGADVRPMNAMLSHSSSHTVNLNGRQITTVTDLTWNTFAFVVEPNGNTLLITEAKIITENADGTVTETEVAIPKADYGDSADTLSNNIASFIGTSYPLWTYMMRSTSYSEANSKMYMDFFRVYSVVQEEVVLTVDETAYESDAMIVDMEFDTAEEFTSLTTRSVKPTMSVIDNRGAATFDQTATGRIDFQLKTDDARVAALEEKLAAGPVAFEFNIKSEGGGQLKLLNGIFEHNKSHHLKFNGTKVMDMTDEVWTKLTVVADYSSETPTLKAAKIVTVSADGTQTEETLDASAYTLPAQTAWIGDIPWWTYMNIGNTYSEAGSKVHLDYLRAYTLTEKALTELEEPEEEPITAETKYEVSDWIYNYEFEDEATAFKGLNANVVLPSWEKVDDVGAAVFAKSESGRVAWNISDSDERVATFKTALSSKYLVYEYRLKADGNIRAQFNNNSLEYYNGNINSSYTRAAEMSEDQWIEVTYVVDYTAVTDDTQSGVMKKYTVNDTVSTASITPPTMASLCTSGKFFFSQLADGYTDDGAKLYLDYMRVYAVDPETYGIAEGEIPVGVETKYEVSDWIYNYEFEDEATAFKGLNARYTLPSWETVDNTGAAVFAKSTDESTVGWHIADADDRVTTFKTALSSKYIAYEYRLKADGNIRAQFGNNSLEYFNGNINSKHTRAAEMSEDQWIEVTYVVDYTAVTDDTQSGVMKKYVVNDTVSTASLTPPVKSDLLASGKVFMSQLVADSTDDGAKLYLDYMRAYAVDPEAYAAAEGETDEPTTPVYIDTQYEVKEWIHDYEFEDSTSGLTGLSNRYNMDTLTLETVDNTGVVTFTRTEDLSGTTGFTFDKTNAEKLSAALSGGEVVFETRVKANGNAPIVLFGGNGNSSGTIAYSYNPEKKGTDGINIFGRRLIGSIENGSWVEISVVLDCSGEIPVAKTVMINDEIIESSVLNMSNIVTLPTASDYVDSSTYLWTYIVPSYCDVGASINVDYLRIYSIDSESTSAIIRRIDVSKRTELAEVSNYDETWTINADGTFADLDYTASADRMTHIERVRGMAAEYANKGRTKYLDTALLAQINSTLSYYINANFDYVGTTGNWSNALEAPKYVADVFILLKNAGETIDEELLALAKTNYFDISESNDAKSEDGIANAKSFAYNTSNLPVTGSLWMALSNIYDSTVENDQVYINKIYDSLSAVLTNHADENGKGVAGNDVDASDVTDTYFGDGFYPDGSYLGHGPLHYTFGYGQQFLGGCVKFVELAAGTEYQPEADKLNILAGIVLDNMRWLVRGDNSEYTGIGRSIEAYDKNGNVSGGRINQLGNYAKKLLSEPNMPRKAELTAFLAQLNENQSAQAGVSYITGNKYFWMSDLMAHQRDKYFTEVKMSGTRTRKTERVGDLGANTYYLSDGTTPIMVNGNEYEKAIAVWDWDRLPGITAINSETLPQLVDSSDYPNYHYGNSDFVGGASDGTYGAAAMDYATDRQTRTKDNPTVVTPVVSAKKSWFFFDDEFVALGTDISSTEETDPLYTNINQCIADGEISSGTAGTVNWTHHGNVGYILPDSQAATAEIKTQTNGDFSQNIFSMYINHGTSVSNANYSYIAVPGATSAEVEAYAADIPVEIVQNDASIQAVYHNELKILQAVFREAGKLTLANGSIINVTEPCIIIVKETAGGYEITSQNPYGEEAAFTVDERFDNFINTYDETTGISTVALTPANGLYAGSSVMRKLTKVYFTDESGNKVTELTAGNTININFEKKLVAQNNSVVIAAIYAADGTLKDTAKYDCDLSTVEGDIVTNELTLANDVTATDSIRIYIWNSENEMQPVTKAQYMTK